jgi:hypothetical protein
MIKCVTRNRPKAFLLCLFVVILSLSLFGCGGTFRSFPNEGDVSGNWTLFLVSSGTSSIGPKVMTLAQTDKNIVGTTADGALLTGTISGADNITLILANADRTTTTLSGTAGPDWKTMSGTYTSTGSDGSGTWSATKILPTPTPTPTPAPLTVAPAAVTLSCSGQTGLTSTTFQVNGGTPSKYTVTASPTTLVILSTTTLTTNGQFTVTANACSAPSAVVTLTVTDTVTSVNVTATISNP